MKKILQFMRPFYDASFYTRGGYFTWVAAGITVVTAVGGAVAANQQAKKAQAGAEAANAQGQAAMGKIKFKAPWYPEYMPLDFKQTQKGAIEQDQQFYARSDADFKRRHAPTAQAEKLFEESVLKDQQGEHELMPMVQGELARAGIAGALESFGPAAGASSLAPGSAGEASVARNLGLGILDFQDRNRDNREKSLQLAEEIFPRRTFGMSGADFASNAANNAENTNAWAQAKYAADYDVAKTKYGIATGQQNAVNQGNTAMASAKAESDAARTAAIVNAASTALSAGAQAYGAKAGQGGSSVSGAARPAKARYPGSQTWVPVGQYA